MHAQLHGAELAALEADMKQNYPVLRRTSYGKQVIAIEKLLFGIDGPSSVTTSSRSSTLPSTNASSTVEDTDTPPPHVKPTGSLETQISVPLGGSQMRS